jgi:protein TonB
VIDRARRRLLLALGASALLHLWIAHTADGNARRSTAAGVAAITATLNAPAAQPAPQAVPVHQAPLAEDKAAAIAEPRRGTATLAAPVASAHALSPPAAAAEPSATLAPSDPTYYTARSLDVYPRALTALNLGLQAADGKVRAMVLIDESGTVNEVREIEAGALETGNAVRDLLLRTRFTPASKDGRVVKAQLLLSLN